MRLRDLGLKIGDLSPGPLNAITDVEGVRVGHTPLIEGEGPLEVGLIAWKVRHQDPPDVFNALFYATIEATEEAIANALLQAETMTGRDCVHRSRSGSRHGGRAVRPGAIEGMTLPMLAVSDHAR